MRISVCMGIYNGEKYIRQQLDCIRQQTRLPEEVILCDDGSTDGTREIVKEYLADYPGLNGWKLYENQKNKGYPANFYDAMRLCNGDIVFLADQDDIWDIRKIERMCQVMESDDKILVLGCTFGLIDEKNEAIHSVMAPAERNTEGKLRAVSIDQVFYKCEWPGMVLAYRNAWYCKSAEQKHPDIPHDFLICARAADEEGFYQLEEILAYHRRHEENAGGEEHRIGRLLNKERKLKEIRDYNRILEEFRKESVLKTEKGNDALQEKCRSMQERYQALCSGKIRSVLKNAWKYRKEVRFATVVCDVLIVRQKSRG